MYNEIQLTKNKMNLNNLKMTNHPPSPGSQRNSTMIDKDTKTVFRTDKLY